MSCGRAETGPYGFLHAFVAVLFFCGAVIIGSFLLKDVPKREGYEEEVVEGECTSEADVSIRS